MEYCVLINRPISVVVTTSLSVREVWGSITDFPAFEIERSIAIGSPPLRRFFKAGLLMQ